MSRLLLIVLMLVLPLRGWAGDLMALGMAEQQLVTMAAEAANADAMPADCGMAMHQDQESSPGGECCSCQLCLPLADLAWTAPDLRPTLAQRVPQAAAETFLSATAPPAQRPPISA